MLYVIAFLIMGAALYVFVSVCIAVDKQDIGSLMTDIMDWRWWVCMLRYMIFWPMIIGRAFYIVIQQNK